MLDQEILKNYLDSYFDERHEGKHYLLMLFATEMELGLSNQPNRWECSGFCYFNNGTEALNAYANTPNPASQLIDARSKNELFDAAVRMNENMKDEKWLNENLYPYL